MMQQKLIDSNEIYTSVGVFKREIIIYELQNTTCPVSIGLYFNGKEYNEKRKKFFTLAEKSGTEI